MTTRQKETDAERGGLEAWAETEVTLQPDRLLAQVEIYEETILLRQYLGNTAWVKRISAEDLADAFAGDIEFATGLLPPETLWHRRSHERNETALWRGPRMWKVAVQTEPFQPADRYTIPMPGLVFVCNGGNAPKAYAAKERPTSEDDILYRIPTYNVFATGGVCSGSHRFPQNVNDIPESFFQSRFSKTGDHRGRSKKHPEQLIELWKELDGQEEFPLEDLVPQTTVKAVMHPDSNTGGGWNA